ncbi:hypothetical protein [Aestuariibaculum sediminum]|uniref:Rieske domain-containing protein n=1 Tax=Aestuariibaculum sediminum TaxID=2770637 RepID=A0A8J6Q1B8_9FLAO|nr:hypothetical protein [Aestuariibaculum sediminum]MBD0830974.1 hypothetical protein [Aestuariibaculum sediminum]
MKLILQTIILLFIFSCSSDDVIKNPYLPNYKFNTNNFIDTRLPQYNKLQLPGNSVILTDYGINGIVIFYAGGDNYNAFELSDPNHEVTSCSKLTVDGVIASCSCNDNNSYEILTGNMQEGTSGQYPLLRYNVEVTGSIIRVFNN